MMIIDHSVYPDVQPPPVDLPTLEAKADYVHRICAAFDFDIFPEESDWATFAQWKDVFDRFPLPDSAGYRAFRHWFGWEPIPAQQRLGTPRWQAPDIREGRIDPCDEMI